MYRPFIDDPHYVSQFDGQRFIVLRATGAVADVFEQVKNTLRQRFLDVGLSYIAQPHVTLCGVAAGTSLESVRDLAGMWAPHVSPVALDVEALDSFPDPFRVVIVRVRKTPELFHALSTLRRVAEERGPRCANEVAVDAWTFHMSVAYGASLTPAEWDDVARFVPAVAVPAAHCTVQAAEVVAFDKAREYSGGLYRLGLEQTGTDT